MTPDRGTVGGIRILSAAERADENRDRERTDHGTVRFPKEVAEDEIAASSENGVLEVELPIHGGQTRGKEIELACVSFGRADAV